MWLTVVRFSSNVNKSMYTSANVAFLIGQVYNHELSRRERRRSIARSIILPNSAIRSFEDRTRGSGLTSPLDSGKQRDRRFVQPSESFCAERGVAAFLGGISVCSVKRGSFQRGRHCTGQRRRKILRQVIHEIALLTKGCIFANAFCIED